MVLPLVLAMVLQSAEVDAAPPAPPAPASFVESVGSEWRPMGYPKGARRLYYPQNAAMRGITGMVVLECIVSAKGAVPNCRVLSETPPGLGFGEAAIQMAGLFKMKPAWKDGVAVDGTVVKIPVKFQLPN